MAAIKAKRIYDQYRKADGYRVLVDRVWPRGIKKENAAIDLWLKDIAPSTELRKWFNHDPEKWSEFQKRYAQELKDKKDLISQLVKETKKHTVTLLFAAKDQEHNNAVVLRKLLMKKMK